MYKASIRPRAMKKLKLLLPLIDTKAKVLEIGSGNCGLAYLLKQNGFSIQATDIVDNSFYNEIKPEIFNGEKLDYPDKSFDYTIIITVLHHTTSQKELLLEARRLGRTVIVMEDIFTHKTGEKLLKFTDSLVNLEFKNHPHTNRTDISWKFLFEELGFTLQKSIYLKTLGYFRQVVYVLA